MVQFNHFEFFPHKNIWIFNFKNKDFGNSFSYSCAKELSKICNLAKKKKPDAIIITTKDRIFCSGGNLKDYAKLKKREPGIKINRFISKTFSDFYKLPIPTLCLLRGDCFGGGIEWLSCFDRIIALPHVYLGMWQRKIGLTWGWGGGYKLKMRVQKHKLLQLLSHAETISAFEALKIGLIDEIQNENHIDAASLSWIKKQNLLPKKSYEMIKNQNLKKEKNIFEKLWMNDEHRKILNSYLK